MLLAEHHASREAILLLDIDWPRQGWLAGNSISRLRRSCVTEFKLVSNQEWQQLCGVSSLPEW